MCEQLSMSTLTGEKVTGDDDSVIKEELLFCNRSYVFKVFKVTLMKVF